MTKATLYEKVFDKISFEIETRKTALVIVDMQYLDAHRDFGIGADAKRHGVEEAYEYYYDQVERVVVPNTIRLLESCRNLGIQVIFPRVASLVSDCREISLEHKRINLKASAGSRESEILDEIKPIENEIVLSKGASGVFNSTAIDQILRNLGIETLIITGVVTNYCVETAVRDAGDRGYNVVLVSDACAALSEVHQRLALEILAEVYCVVKDTNQIISEIEAASKVAVV